ncbi:hypothetical protein HK102_008100, partial [Quaeritorhiza haematococci]
FQTIRTIYPYKRIFDHALLITILIFYLSFGLILGITSINRVFSLVWYLFSGLTITLLSTIIMRQMSRTRRRFQRLYASPPPSSPSGFTTPFTINTTARRTFWNSTIMIAVYWVGMAAYLVTSVVFNHPRLYNVYFVGNAVAGGFTVVFTLFAFNVIKDLGHLFMDDDILKHFKTHFFNFTTTSTSSSGRNSPSLPTTTILSKDRRQSSIGHHEDLLVMTFAVPVTGVVTDMALEEMVVRHRVAVRVEYRGISPTTSSSSSSSSLSSAEGDAGDGKGAGDKGTGGKEGKEGKEGDEKGGRRMMDLVDVVDIPVMVVVGHGSGPGSNQLPPANSK